MTHSESMAAVITAIRARLRGEELPGTLTQANTDLIDAITAALRGADLHHLAEIGAAAIQELHGAMHAQVRAEAALLNMQRDPGPAAGDTTH
jgi:hypothetical protein